MCVHTPIREGVRDAALLYLPSCLERAAADQQRDLQLALPRLPRRVCQHVLQGLEAHHKDGSVCNVTVYLFGLIKRVGKANSARGQARDQRGERCRPRSVSLQRLTPTASSMSTIPTQPFKPATSEVVRSYLDSIRRQR